MADTHAPSLSQFTSELRTRNISRPNQYYVQIIAPKIFSSQTKGFDSTDIGLVSMWCHTAQTPQAGILTDDSYIEAGTRRKFAYDQDYQNLTLSFYIDQDYKIKRFFDQWKQAIVPQRRNFGYPDDYTAPSLKLYIVNQADIATYEYEYIKIYPKTIQAVELSYATGIATSTFTVEFVFEDVYYSSLKFGNLIDFTSKPDNAIIPSKQGLGVTNPEVKQSITNPTITSLSKIVSGGGSDFGGGGADSSY